MGASLGNKLTADTSSANLGGGQAKLAASGVTNPYLTGFGSQGSNPYLTQTVAPRQQVTSQFTPSQIEQMLAGYQQFGR